MTTEANNPPTLETKADQASAIGLPLFFSPDMTVSIANDLEAAQKARATRWLGRWDRESGFCLMVLVRDGLPFNWCIEGPYNRDQALRFFNTCEADLSGANSSDVRH